MDQEDGDRPDAEHEPLDAGAASPEELRALAERLREQREREQSEWRKDVRPELMRSKRKRPSLSDLRSDEPDLELADGGPGGSSSEVRWLALGAILVALVIILIAAQSSVWLVLIPVIGALGYAWWYGRQQTGEDDPPD